MTLKTLGLVATLVFSLAAPLSADAQAGKIWRIGFLSLFSGELDQYKPWVAAFRDGLREHGYVEGENVVNDPTIAARSSRRDPSVGEITRRSRTRA